jgi:hypothetical protein
MPLLRELEIQLRAIIGTQTQDYTVCNAFLESGNTAILPCAHTFCQTCLMDLSEDNNLRCPICDEGFDRMYYFSPYDRGLGGGGMYMINLPRRDMIGERGRGRTMQLPGGWEVGFGNCIFDIGRDEYRAERGQPVYRKGWEAKEGRDESGIGIGGTLLYYSMIPMLTSSLISRFLR